MPFDADVPDDERRRHREHLLAVLEFELGLTWDRRAGLWVTDGPQAAIAVGDAGIFVGWLDVEWPQPSTPRLALRDIAHLDEAQPAYGTQALLADWLERARTQCRGSMRRCRMCGEGHLPGHMDSADLCQGCATRHFGVVY